MVLEINPLEESNEDDSDNDSENGSRSQNFETNDEDIDDDIDADPNFDVISRNDEFDDLTLPKHFRCASHTLNLLASSDYNKFIKKSSLNIRHERVMKKCNELWKNLRARKKRVALVNFLDKCIKKPVITRWNSMFEALSDVNSVKEKLLLSEAKKALNLTKNFTEDDFDYINFYLDLMKPLAITLDRLQGEKNCHFGYLLPSLIKLRIDWEKQLVQTSAFQNIIQNLIDKLEIRFFPHFNVTGYTGEFAAIAALVHPRFKKKWVKCLSSEAQNRIGAIIDQIAATLNPSNDPSEEVVEEDSMDFELTTASPVEGLQDVSIQNSSSDFHKYLKENPSKDLTVILVII